MWVLVQTEDGLVHLQWLERTEAGLSTAEPENDVILFPGEATFEKVGEPVAWPAPWSVLFDWLGACMMKT